MPQRRRNHHHALSSAHEAQAKHTPSAGQAAINHLTRHCHRRRCHCHLESHSASRGGGQHLESGPGQARPGGKFHPGKVSHALHTRLGYVHVELALRQSYGSHAPAFALSTRKSRQEQRGRQQKKKFCPFWAWRARRRHGGGAQPLHGQSTSWHAQQQPKPRQDCELRTWLVPEAQGKRRGNARSRHTRAGGMSIIARQLIVDKFICNLPTIGRHLKTSVRALRTRFGYAHRTTLSTARLAARAFDGTGIGLAGDNVEGTDCTDTTLTEFMNANIPCVAQGSSTHSAG